VLTVLPGRALLIPHLFHRAVAALLGIRITQQGMRPGGRPRLIAANHVSWLDIVVLSAAMPVSFVAKSEVAGWPGIGVLAKLQRTIFVDRKRRLQTAATTRAIGERLSSGGAVVLFAEGTSSDHNRVLPFRPALLGAAREALAASGESVVEVQPVSIAYPRRHGLPVLRRDRPEIAWYGAMTLPNHLWNILKFGGPEAVLTFGRPIAVTAADNRKEIALRAETEVREMTAAVLRGVSPILSGAQTG
jgi:1-acyl-sn-glycerol-3-phosphate acyltransferase